MWYSSRMRLAIGDTDPVAYVDPPLWDAFVAQQKEAVANGTRWMAVKAEDGADVVWVRLAPRDGRTAVTALLIASTDALDRAALRDITVAKLRDFTAARADDAMRLRLPPEEALRSRPLPREAGPGAGRPRHSSEALEVVAQAWAAALLSHPSTPMKQTAAALGYSLSQARRLVRRAEAEGIIKASEEE